LPVRRSGRSEVAFLGVHGSAQEIWNDALPGAHPCSWLVAAGPRVVANLYSHGVDDLTTAVDDLDSGRLPAWQRCARPVDGDDLSTGSAPSVLRVPRGVASRAKAQPKSNARRADCSQCDEYVDHERCVVEGSASGLNHGATVAGLEYLRSVSCFLCSWGVTCGTRGSSGCRTTTRVCCALAGGAPGHVEVRRCQFVCGPPAVECRASVAARWTFGPPLTSTSTHQSAFYLAPLRSAARIAQWAVGKITTVSLRGKVTKQERDIPKGALLVTTHAGRGMLDASRGGHRRR